MTPEQKERLRVLNKKRTFTPEEAAELIRLLDIEENEEYGVENSPSDDDEKDVDQDPELDRANGGHDLQDDCMADLDRIIEDVAHGTGDDNERMSVDADDTGSQSGGGGDNLATDGVAANLYASRAGVVWSTEVPRQSVRVAAENVIAHAAGPVNEARNVTNPLDAFSLFVDDAVVGLIVTMTNRRGHDEYSRNNAAWKDTDDVEIRAFIGILILAGILRSSKEPINDLWSDDETIRRAIFPATMSRNRFVELHRHITFDDVTIREAAREHDRMCAFRELSDLLADRFRHWYLPNENVTVDEQLVGFRGRCSFRVYMPDKPAKFGIKVWAACDAHTFYCSNFDVYCGAVPGDPLHNDPHEVVMRMTGHLGKGYNVTTDNYFTSLPLANALLRCGAPKTLVGTVRKNKREVPPDFLNVSDRERKSSIFGFHEKATLLSYIPDKKIKKVVLLLSTLHHDDAIRNIDGVVKPDIIHFYNRTKSGVDTMDEMVASFRCYRRSARWPFVLFCNFLDISAINAYVILAYNSQRIAMNQNSRRPFLLELGKALVGPHIRRRDTTRLHRPVANAVDTVRRSLHLVEEVVLPPDIEVVDDPATSAVRQLHAAKKGRCACCEGSNSKASRKCDVCTKFACRKHSQVEKRTVCSNCLKLL